MMRAGIVLGAAIVMFAAALLSSSPTTEATPGPSVELPDQAVEVGPNVFSLGTTQHNGHAVEGLLFVYTADGNAHPARGGGHGKPTPTETPTDTPTPTPTATPEPGDASTCYSFIDTTVPAANWPGLSGESWLFDPSGSGIDVTVADMKSALQAWDGVVGAAIFGNGSEAGGLDVALDDSNEVFFARLVGPGAGNTIAATWVWYDKGGDIFEWDMVFNTKFAWSLGADPSAMNFANIATHEAGHAAGMGHTDAIDLCVEQTMYPTGSYGEIEKASLESGDTTGIHALYP